MAASWYLPALALRQEMERAGIFARAKLFIRGLLNSGSREEAENYVRKARVKWEREHGDTTSGYSQYRE